MAKKQKIPKKIAGFRVPKGIRRSPILSMLLGSETGRQILANALVAGASAAAAALAKKHQDDIADAGGAAKKEMRKGKNFASRAVKDATGAMAAVIADAAKTLMPEDRARGKGARRAAARTH